MPFPERRELSFRRLVTNRFRRFWRVNQWPVVWGCGAAAILLGYVGFQRYFVLRGKPEGFWDLVYLTIQLFPLQSGAVDGPLPWQLHVARLLAPAVLAYTATRALIELFEEQLHRFWIRLLWRRHAVICGLGRKGALLARAFRQAGYPVVVVEQDAENDHIADCRAHGVRVLIGSAADREVLRSARVSQAKYVVCVAGDDGVNAEVAVSCRQLVGDRGGDPLVCLTHIFDPLLCSLLTERSFAVGEPSSFRLHFFNVFDQAAVACLGLFLPLNTVDPARAPHLIIMGLGRMGQSLVEHAARRWKERLGQAGQRLRVTVIDVDAVRKTEALRLRIPALNRLCEFIPVRTDTRSPDFYRADFLKDGGKRIPVDCVFVCFDNDSLATAAGLAIHKHLQDSRVPVVVRMKRDAGLAALLDGTAGGGAPFADLHAFGLYDRTCRLQILLHHTHEIVAQGFHEEYIQQQLSEGQTAATNSSMRSWDHLPEPLKESNRQQADHIRKKLDEMGCVIRPLMNWEAPPFVFEEAEIERLARMEHERFREERIRAGWRYAEGPKDPVHMTNPTLVPWEQLSEKEKEKDRNFIRKLPAILARVGYEIHRSSS